MTIAAVDLPDGATLQLDDERWSGFADTAEITPVRAVYAAAHVVMLPSYATVDHSPSRPGASSEIAEFVDWDATMAFRRHLARHGFGIAEAMDTAQRFNLGWDGARRLIESCGRLDLRGGFVAGAGTDHLSSIDSTKELVDGVLHQCRVIADNGGIAVILPMPWLTANRCADDVYLDVYARIIAGAPGPLIIHWLGPMFLPELDGYFPGDSFERILAIDPSVVRGAKLSMLDADLEIRVRRGMLERGQVMLTGDDYHFGGLIEGDGGAASTEVRLGDRPIGLGDFSHALLGIFDAIAAPMGIALRLLAHGRTADYRTIVEPCERLGCHIFEPPTRHYKTGLAFLAWLNGLQSTPMLVNHEERCRSTEHLIEAVRLANDAGAILDAPTAAARLAAWLDQRK